MRTPKTQRGAAFMLLLLSLATLFAVGLMSMYNADRARIRKDTHVQTTLAEAKAALIGYAVTHTSRPGSLPCPDNNYDGLPNQTGSNCSTTGGGVIRAGWLPWRTLGLPDLSDESGSRLWYSSALEFNELSTIALNSDSAGTLAVDAQGDVAAVIIAPGLTLAGQNRPANPSSANTQRAAFLESENSDADTQYAQGQSQSDTLNDRVLLITRTELMRAVERRVAGEMAKTLQAYATACSQLPVPAPFRDPSLPGLFDSVAGTEEGFVPVDTGVPAAFGFGCAASVSPLPWFRPNNWHQISYLAMAPAGCSPGVDCLRLSDGATTRNDVQGLFIVAGQDLSGSRHSANLGDYLEGDNASAADRSFDARPASGNDILKVVLP